MNRFFMLVLLVGLDGCSVQETIILVRDTDYHYEVIKNNAEHRFDIKITAGDNSAICMSFDEWPNKGVLDFGSERAWVTTASGKTIPARDFDFGICPGGCGYTKIDPNQSLVGYINFDQFIGFNDYTTTNASILKYAVSPTACKANMKIIKHIRK
jgi:hypothetical protein